MSSKNSKRPKGVIIAVFGISDFCIGTWWYPFSKSILEKIVEPCKKLDKSWRLGRGYLSGVVAAFKRRWSPHGRQLPFGLGTIWSGLDHGESERRTIPRLSNSLKVFSATANCSGERRHARAAMGGQAVWIEWVVWWRGVGQVVSEAQVTAGYLARRESTSGGHWDTGGGGGELRGGVAGRWVETLAEGGGGGGAVAKQAVALIEKKELWMPYNQQKFHDEIENLSQEWVAKPLLAKNCEQKHAFQILSAYVQNSVKVLQNHLRLLLQGQLLPKKK